LSKKVIVAMSGGVDSSVCALLLKRQGYEVVGITMQIWPSSEDQSRACCSLEAVNDARSVASKLDIPYYVFNFQEEFKRTVIDYFCQEYRRGRTPNPCIVCNRNLKFQSLLNKALVMDADYIATGHYARIVQDESSDLFKLLMGNDSSKDQSYALYTLNQYQLAHTMFPLSNYTKQEVRKLAKDADLPVSSKAESQDICFVPDGNYGAFVDKYLGLEKQIGLFRYSNGESLGPHKGVHHYTIGQRKGLGLAMGHPVYVTAIDADSNTVWVGENQELFRDKLIADDVHYVSGIPLNDPTELSVKIRYSSQSVPAQVIPLNNNRIEVEFHSPQRAITPGQAVVFYDGEQVIGGGTIL